MNDFFFQVADAAFHLHFNEITDARPLLPSYAPFYIKDRKDTSVIFDMTIGDNLVSFIPDGEEIGTFDCGGINHGIYKRPEGGYFITITDVGANRLVPWRLPRISQSAEPRFSVVTTFGVLA